MQRIKGPAILEGPAGDIKNICRAYRRQIITGPLLPKRDIKDSSRHTENIELAENDRIRIYKGSTDEIKNICRTYRMHRACL